MVEYPKPCCPWAQDARWHASGLPANVEAVLHRQCQRARTVYSVGEAMLTPPAATEGAGR